MFLYEHKHLGSFSNLHYCTFKSSLNLNNKHFECNPTFFQSGNSLLVFALSFFAVAGLNFNFFIRCYNKIDQNQLLEWARKPWNNSRTTWIIYNISISKKIDIIKLISIQNEKTWICYIFCCSYSLWNNKLYFKNLPKVSKTCTKVLLVAYTLVLFREWTNRFCMFSIAYSN